MTSAYAASNRSRMAPEAFARLSQFSATVPVGRLDRLVLGQLERGQLLLVL